MKYLRWFGKVVRAYGFPLTMMILSHVVLAGCAIAFVYICKSLVDSAVATFNGTTTASDIMKWLLWLVAVVLVRIAINACRSYIQAKTEVRMKNDLRRKLFDIMLRVQIILSLLEIFYTTELGMIFQENIIQSLY